MHAVGADEVLAYSMNEGTAARAPQIYYMCFNSAFDVSGAARQRVCGSNDDGAQLEEAACGHGMSACKCEMTQNRGEAIFKVLIHHVWGQHREKTSEKLNKLGLNIIV